MSDATNKDHPDAQLHPTATGLAKQTVDAHQKEEPLKLYAGWLYVANNMGILPSMRILTEL